METKGVRMQPQDRPRLQRLLEAHRKFMETGISDVRCDNCGELIQFTKLGSNGERSSCTCGKYNGTMKGEA
jgi:hypothetical protein